MHKNIPCHRPDQMDISIYLWAPGSIRQVCRTKMSKKQTIQQESVLSTRPDCFILEMTQISVGSCIKSFREQVYP